MPELENHTDQPVSLPTGHVIEAYGTRGVSEATWARLQGEGYVRAMMRRGDITIARPAAPVSELTRATIARATRSELLDIIMAHSDWTEDDLEGVTVEGRDGEDGLRDMAANIVFVDL